MGPKPQRKKRGRSSSSSSSSSTTRTNSTGVRSKAKKRKTGEETEPTPIERRNDGEADNGYSDNNEVHVLDGVEYEKYTDFVAAKRQRNETYLRNLGFHKKVNKLPTNNSTRSNRRKPARTNEDGEAAAAAAADEITTTAPGSLSPPSLSHEKRSRLVSPASSYYDRYNDGVEPCFGDGGIFGMSLESASLTKNPFDEVSSWLLKMEREQNRRLERRHSKSGDTTADIGKGPADAIAIDVDESADTAAGRRKRTGSASTTTNAKIPEESMAIIALLEEALARVAPSQSSDDHSAREGYLNAFHQLNGIPLILRLLEEIRDDGDEESKHNGNDGPHRPEIETIDDGDNDIAALCIFILRDVCCLSVFPTVPGAPSPSEKLALDLVYEQGLETLHDMAASIKDIPGGEKILLPVKKRGRPPKKSAAESLAEERQDAKRRNILETIRNAWSVYANLTYFESVTAAMGKEDLMALADLAFWTVAALDCYVTKELVQLLPLATTQELPKGKKRVKKQKTPITKPKVVKETLAIATEAARVLEPVLGTIRNLVADPLAAPMDWEAKSFVSKFLDVVCKGEDRTKPRARADVKDWLHFVKQSFVSPETLKAAPTAPITTVFRWMEQSEGAVWELLSVFKVCLGKGITPTDTHDVERLAGVWIRCLKRFGSSSVRIVRRVLGLVDCIIIPPTTVDVEDGSSTTSAAVVRIGILLREGFLDELVDLAVVYSRGGDNDRSLSECEALRIEIESTISRLR